MPTEAVANGVGTVLLGWQSLVVHASPLPAWGPAYPGTLPVRGRHMQTDSWLGQPTTARVTGDFFYYVDSPADPAVEKMENEPVFERKVMLSWVALIKDPGCIEAHLFRGSCAKAPDLRMQHLQAAVMAGHDLWDPVAKAEVEDMTWWGFAATRPYMRAIKALGLEHHARGDLRAARDCFEALLDMNPNDNQGVRQALDVMDAESATAPRM